MTETVTYCARACVRPRRHLPDCADTDCRGCAPRHAHHGTLCDPCHRRLSTLIHDAPTIHAWLTVYLPHDGQAPRTDAERRHATPAPPARR